MSENTGEFKVIFRGVRGSHPVSGQDNLKYGGHTSCVEVRVDGRLIILDAGTGIVSLGNDLLKQHIASGTSETNRKHTEALMLFSHTHNDHLQGFPFFKPAYLNTTKLHIFGPRNFGLDFEKIMERSMFTPFFPIELGEMASHITINNIKETDLMILHPGKTEPERRRVNPLEEPDLPQDAIIIRNIKSYAHPRDGVYLYKISWKGHSVVYATDKENYIGGDSRLASFARNTDLLIHDAQYTNEDYTSIIAPKQGYGHSTPEMAVDAAKQTGARKLVLFHHDPSYNDKKIESLEESAKAHFKNSIAAYEGLEIDII